MSLKVRRSRASPAHSQFALHLRAVISAEKNHHEQCRWQYFFSSCSNLRSSVACRGEQFTRTCGELRRSSSCFGVHLASSVPVVEYIAVARAVSNVAADAAVHAAPAPVMEYFLHAAPATVVVYMYPALAVHAAAAPVVECISQEFKRRTHVGAAQPGHRAGNVCWHVFFEAGNAADGLHLNPS